MMARMPELSSGLTSPTLKPSRLSISSCDRTRSPPFLPPPKSRLPSSTMAAHCSAMVPESSLAAGAPGAFPGSPGFHGGFPLGCDGILVVERVASHDPRSAPSLNDDFLEQHRVDLIWRDRRVDPPGQFFLEAKQPRRTVEIGRPQFAQIGLENIGDARHRRLDQFELLLFLD